MWFSLLVTGALFNLISTRSIRPSTQYLCSTVGSNSANYSSIFESLSKTETAFQLDKRNLIEIPTYFHVVHTEVEGRLSATTLNEQLNVMNKGYAPHGIQFTLQGVDETLEPTWAKPVRHEDIAAMKEALHQGDFTALNMYFMPVVGVEDPMSFGLCEFPFDLPPGTPDKPFYMDGCLVRSDTVPGGSVPLVNLGATAVHEVGHWFGLFHTFQGDLCFGPGDWIDDTPPQQQSTQVLNYCPYTDTCPGDYALDQITNFMDYSADACLSHFTPGQEARMRSVWFTYRVTQSPLYKALPVI